MRASFPECRPPPDSQQSQVSSTCTIVSSSDVFLYDFLHSAASYAAEIYAIILDRESRAWADYDVSDAAFQSEHRERLSNMQRQQTAEVATRIATNNRDIEAKTRALEKRRRDYELERQSALESYSNISQGVTRLTAQGAVVAVPNYMLVQMTNVQGPRVPAGISARMLQLICNMLRNTLHATIKCSDYSVQTTRDAWSSLGIRQPFPAAM